MKHPIQPIIVENGVARFQKNAIIEWLFKTGKLNLNEISLLHFSDDDQMQLAQLIGYSVSGFGDLPYADKDVVLLADKEVERKLEELYGRCCQ